MVSVSDMDPVSAKAEDDIIDKIWGVVMLCLTSNIRARWGVGLLCSIYKIETYIQFACATFMSIEYKRQVSMIRC